MDETGAAVPTDSTALTARTDSTASADSTARTDPAGAAVSAVWRIEAPRLVAGLTRLVGGDLGLAEDLAQDALVAALEQWPETGVPRNPGAWLMTVAKRRAVDLIRRDQNYARKLELLGRDLETGATSTSRGPSRPSMSRTSRTTCSASCSPRAIRCSPPRRAWP